MRVYLCLSAAVICHQHLLYTPQILFGIPVRQRKGERGQNVKDSCREKRKDKTNVSKEKLENEMKRNRKVKDGRNEELSSQNFLKSPFLKACLCFLLTNSQIRLFGWPRWKILVCLTCSSSERLFFYPKIPCWLVKTLK